MAKTSWINRNDRKRKTVQKYAALRAELKAKKDYIGLSQLIFSPRQRVNGPVSALSASVRRALKLFAGAPAALEIH